MFGVCQNVPSWSAPCGHLCSKQDGKTSWPKCNMLPHAHRSVLLQKKHDESMMSDSTMEEIREGRAEEMSNGDVAHCNHYNQQPCSATLSHAQPSTSPLSHPLIKESKLLEPVLPHGKNAT